MTNEQCVLLALMKAHLTDTVAQLPPNVSFDWDALMREAAHQTVAPAALDAVSKVAVVPKEVYAGWRQFTFVNLAINSRLNLAQADLVALMDKHDIPYVVIKGTVSAYYYPRPELRPLGDVDLYIEPSCTDKMMEVLEQNGYVAIPGSRNYHVAFDKDGLSFEVHFAFIGMLDPIIGPDVRAYLADMMTQAVSMESPDSGVTPFAAPTPDRHGLLLLLHMQQHLLGEGVGLRHLCDWAAFVHRTADEPFWAEKLLPMLERVGLKVFAVTLTKMCHLYLGTACPAWAQGAREEVCAALMQDILDGGNFGRKDKHRKYSGRMISQRNAGKWITMWRTLHNSTVDWFPFVRKWKILYPFLDGYRICRYLWLVAQKKRPKLDSYADLTNHRKNLYAQLHIFETKE